MAGTDTTNLNENNKGLFTDSSMSNQPKGTYRYALNVVNESADGDQNFRNNEESNEPCATFPDGFVPIGKTYKNEKEVIVALVKQDNTVSEIGMITNNCEYITYVNDELSAEKDKLNFKVENQIDISYRSRRGCEDTIYFTENGNKPRYFNFAKPEEFQNNDGTWAAKKFNLFREYNKIPVFKTVKVNNSGGNLLPGSYNIAFRYLDNGLNPTEFVLTSEIINIYNDLTDQAYNNINGSINSESDYLNFGKTTKAISVVFNNIDDSFPYYQLAFIEATNGSGQVSSVKYTEVIPTTKDFFIYTGDNAITEGTEEEITIASDIIDRAEFNIQFENRLLLANTKGKQVDFCRLQKYASKIKADLVTKKVYLNVIDDPLNAKNPTVKFSGVEYMPGEIYAFAIVYVFEDGSMSFGYHIPGKSPNVGNDIIFSPGEHTYPMSNDNQSQNNRYIDNSTCEDTTYWGLDSEGISLEGKAVRHHRFPLRSDIGLPLVRQEESTGEIPSLFWRVQLNMFGTIDTSVICSEEEIEEGTCTPKTAEVFQVRVAYSVDGELYTFIYTIDPNYYTDNTGFYTISPLAPETAFSPLYTSNNITVITIEETDANGDFVIVPDGTTSPKGLNYSTEIDNYESTKEDRIFSTDLFGIKFSGIELPNEEDTNGEKVVGYYIVRCERTENEKTILDSGVLTQSLINSKYISHGLLAPDVDSSKVSKDVFGFIHPEHKFNNHEYISYDKIIHQGNFNVTSRKMSKIRYNDILDGSSYNSKYHKSGNDDGHDADGNPNSRGYDGWSLACIVRDNMVNFSSARDFEVDSFNIKERFYLRAIESKDINNSQTTAYNISSDNRVGIIQLYTQLTIPNGQLPYVLLKRNIADSYSNFRVLPYYKDSKNLETGTTATIFGGDTYISPMRYANTVFWQNRNAKRKGKSGIFQTILGIFIAVAGAVLSIVSAGFSTILVGAGIALIGGGVLVTASGIQRDKWEKAYSEEYDKGLRETALDNWVDQQYVKPSPGRDGPSDDEIQWIGDCITDLWFESQINIQLRNKMTTDVPTFLNSPGTVETGNETPDTEWEFFGIRYQLGHSRYPVSTIEQQFTNKLLVFNSARNDNKEYIGLALGEYYNINPDYKRLNKQKIYYHLPIEYDCCSDCSEKFPHRWHWSEQSFQEELTDNYRVFLPNNYRDIEGETGEITNIFRIGHDLFIHTQEALWQVLRNNQQVVIDQVVSFIGTGDLFNLPPRLIIDDESGNTAGCYHKWASIKTQAGFFFVCEKQRKIFKLTSNGLEPISNYGNANWFQNNLGLLVDKEYYSSKTTPYPYRNNPSNPFGSGFISTYDTKKDRVIFTKKDFQFNYEITDSNDYEICVNDGNLVYFDNFETIIETRKANGWRYLGLEDCKMKFERNIVRSKQEQRTKIINGIPTPITVTVQYLDTVNDYIDGIAIDNPIQNNNSWTMSYSLIEKSWISWHSYLPNFYINVPDKFYSWIYGNNHLWEHGTTGNYLNYYGKLYPFIIEFISVSNPLLTKTWEYIQVLLEAKKYDFDSKEFFDVNEFFNKAIFYNTRQCSGLLDVVQKNKNDQNYMIEQTQNLQLNQITVDRHERDWTFNHLRDIRTNYSKPIFKSNLDSRQSEYYTDKILDISTMDYNKDWSQLESFRDKYLAVRLIFDKFADIKLILNFSLENERQSFR